MGRKERKGRRERGREGKGLITTTHAQGREGLSVLTNTQGTQLSLKRI